MSLSDSLIRSISSASGFVCIAGMEAVAEHSLMHQFGTGRPDQQDEKYVIKSHNDPPTDSDLFIALL